MKDKVDEAFKEVKNATYTSFNYDLATGSITLSDVVVDEQEDVTDLIRAIKAVKDEDKVGGLYFTDVSYNGFDMTEDEKYSLGDIKLEINLNAVKDEDAKDNTKEEAKK